MKALIIYAHPKTEGQNSLMFQEIKKNLKKKKISFSIIDLYKDKFNPVLNANEHYTSGNRFISSQVKKYQKKLTDSEYLIFIYPIWWYSMPAIMKGFLDKVLTARFAFKFKNKLPIGLLKNKAIILCSSGAPAWFYKVKGDSNKKVIKDTLKFCGVKTSYFLIGSADTSENSERVKKLALKVSNLL